MEKWTREEWEEQKQTAPQALFYLYTPFCGTCQVASKMMQVIRELRKDLPIGQADLNYLEDLAIDYKIESVPCLLISENGRITEQIYTFHSIPHLLEKIDGNDGK